VIKINDKSIANRVNLYHFNAACKRVGLKMLKGNREKRKINTPEGLITTSGKKFVWHLYVYLIAWRFILTDFYQLKYNTELPPFDETRAYTLHLIHPHTRKVHHTTSHGQSSQSHKVRVTIHARERSGATPPQRLINRTNHTFSPLFSLDAEGTLSMSERMAKRLDIAKIGHVGKNIRILSTEEH